MGKFVAWRGLGLLIGLCASRIQRLRDSYAILINNTKTILY